MSLEALKQLRIAGYQPPFVQVLVGDIPKWWEECPDAIAIKPSQNPEAMDWRPVVGLHVDLYEIGNHASLLARVSNSVDRAKARIGGIARKGEIIGLNREHEASIKRMLEIFSQ